MLTGGNDEVAIDAEPITRVYAGVALPVSVQRDAAGQLVGGRPRLNKAKAMLAGGMPLFRLHECIGSRLP